MSSRTISGRVRLASATRSSAVERRPTNSRSCSISNRALSPSTRNAWSSTHRIRIGLLTDFTLAALYDFADGSADRTDVPWIMDDRNAPRQGLLKPGTEQNHLTTLIAPQ